MTSDIILRERRQRLQQLKERLATVRGHAARAVWDYGTLLAEVERDELWREDDAESFTAWLEDVLETNRASARKAILVARHFSAEMAERYGSEKLAATVRYLDATGHQEQPGDVLALQLRLRDPRSGHFISKPWAKSTYREIDEATQHVLASQRGRADGPPPEADLKKRAKTLADSLPEAPKGTVRGDRVSLKRGKDGRVAVSFQGIPVEELEGFVAAVRAHLLDG